MTPRSIIALLFVGVSFALGGCAAEAERSPSSDDNLTLGGTLDDDRRLDDVRQIETFADLRAARRDDAARARIIETYNGGVANPRIDVEPPVFGAATQKARGALSPEDMQNVVDSHTIGASKP